ncbi:hypothetical protein HOD08_02705 [bacterium]|nr:hypothetical protein [bacterium]
MKTLRVLAVAAASLLSVAVHAASESHTVESLKRKIGRLEAELGIEKVLNETGIPKEKYEVLFNDFEKLRHHSDVLKHDKRELDNKITHLKKFDVFREKEAEVREGKLAEHARELESSIKSLSKSVEFEKQKLRRMHRKEMKLASAELKSTKAKYHKQEKDVSNFQKKAIDLEGNLNALNHELTNSKHKNIELQFRLDKEVQRVADNYNEELATLRNEREIFKKKAMAVEEHQKSLEFLRGSMKSRDGEIIELTKLADSSTGMKDELAAKEAYLNDLSAYYSEELSSANQKIAELHDISTQYAHQLKSGIVDNPSFAKIKNRIVAKNATIKKAAKTLKEKNAAIAAINGQIMTFINTLALNEKSDDVEGSPIRHNLHKMLAKKELEEISFQDFAESKVPLSGSVTKMLKADNKIVNSFINDVRRRRIGSAPQVAKLDLLDRVANYYDRLKLVGTTYKALLAKTKMASSHTERTKIQKSFEIFNDAVAKGLWLEEEQSPPGVALNIAQAEGLKDLKSTVHTAQNISDDAMETAKDLMENIDKGIHTLQSTRTPGLSPGEISPVNEQVRVGLIGVKSILENEDGKLEEEAGGDVRNQRQAKRSAYSFSKYTKEKESLEAQRSRLAKNRDRLYSDSGEISSSRIAAYDKKIAGLDAELEQVNRQLAAVSKDAGLNLKLKLSKEKLHALIGKTDKAIKDVAHPIYKKALAS